MTMHPKGRQERIRALDSSCSVNEAIAAYPESIGTLNALGVDTCCGGAQPLAEVAAELGMEPDALIARIEARSE